MGIFKKNKKNVEIIYDKQQILKDVLELLKDHPEWKVLKVDGNPCDLLLIKSYELEEQRVITDNPFNKYTKVETKKVQMVVALDVKAIDEPINEDSDIKEWTTSYVVINSSNGIERILKRFK